MATATNAPAAKKDSVGEKKVLTPEFRVSFPSMFKAKSFNGGPEKFSLVMLFDKKSDLTKLKKAVSVAMTEKFGDKSKWPKNWKNPFRDGSEKADLQGYEGMTFVTASSKQKPGLVNNKVEPIIAESDFYAGCYARATVIAYAFDTAGNRGAAFSLQNVQKLRDGDAFSGRKSAEEEFDAVDDGSDDASNFEDSDDLGL